MRSSVFNGRKLTPLAATYAATLAPSLVIKYVVPAPAVTYAAPAPVFEYVAPAPVITVHRTSTCSDLCCAQPTVTFCLHP